MNGTPSHQWNTAGKLALIIGNEGKGISANIKKSKSMRWSPFPWMVMCKASMPVWQQPSSCMRSFAIDYNSRKAMIWNEKSYWLTATIWLPFGRRPASSFQKSELDAARNILLQKNWATMLALKGSKSSVSLMPSICQSAADLWGVQCSGGLYRWGWDGRWLYRALGGRA